MSTTSYQFKGPVLGPLAIVLGLPFVCYLLVYCSNEQVGRLSMCMLLGTLLKHFQKHLHLPLMAAGAPAMVKVFSMQGSLTLSGGLQAPGWPAGISLASWQATAVYLLFLAAQAALHILLPGKKDLGIPLRNGKRLGYKFTGTIP